MVKRKGWCISRARIISFWQIHLMNPDELLYEAGTWDVLLKVATFAEGAVDECVPTAQRADSSGLKSSGMGYTALCLGQSFITWKPSLTLLALTFPFTTVLDSKECKWFNAVSDGLNSPWKWWIYKLREPQQNGSNKLERNSHILNWDRGFCRERLTTPQFM